MPLCESSSAERRREECGARVQERHDEWRNVTRGQAVLRITPAPTRVAPLFSMVKRKSDA